MHPKGDSNTGGWFAPHNGVKLTIGDHEPATALFNDFTLQ